MGFFFKFSVKVGRIVIVLDVLVRLFQRLAVPLTKRLYQSMSMHVVVVVVLHFPIENILMVKNSEYCIRYYKLIQWNDTYNWCYMIVFIKTCNKSSCCILYSLELLFNWPSLSYSRVISLSKRDMTGEPIVILQESSLKYVEFRNVSKFWSSTASWRHWLLLDHA